MNIRRLERELTLYRLADSDLEEIKAEMELLKSYDRPRTGTGRKEGIPDVADQIIARDNRRACLREQERTIRRRKKAVEAAFRKFKNHEYIDAVKRIYAQGQNVRLVAKDMNRDYRTVERHARQLLCQMGETILGVGGL